MVSYYQAELYSDWNDTYEGYIIAEQHSTWLPIEFSFTVEFIIIKAEIIPEEPVLAEESTANSTASSVSSSGVSSNEEEDE